MAVPQLMQYIASRGQMDSGARAVTLLARETRRLYRSRPLNKARLHHPIGRLPRRDKELVVREHPSEMGSVVGLRDALMTEEPKTSVCPSR